MDPNKRLTALEAQNHPFMLRNNETHVQYSIKEVTTAGNKITHSLGESGITFQGNSQVEKNELLIKDNVTEQDSTDRAATPSCNTAKRYTFV